MCAHECTSMYVEVRKLGVCSLLPPYGFQGLNIGFQVWWQVLLPAEPSFSPLQILMYCLCTNF